MECSSACISCLLDHEYERVKEIDDEELKKHYLKDVCKIIGESKDGETAVHLCYLFNNLYDETFKPTHNKFVQINHSFNKLVMDMSEEIEDKINKSSDPIKTALIYSRAGNYIDYGAVYNISTDKFFKLLNRDDTLDDLNYTAFCNKLASSKTLLLLADNCGEIVLDKLLLKTIKRHYPELNMTVMVKKSNVLNDATTKDAEEVGMKKVARIINTGNCIAGCDLRYISNQAQQALQDADIILAKGQANFETLWQTDYDCFFSFLCKCPYFADKFDVDIYQGMFMHQVSLT